MPRNVEIKARIADLAETLTRARAVADGPEVVLEQRDTFFAARQGRLKLRRVGSRAELIQYDRRDVAGPKTSTYHVIEIADPDGLEEALGRAVGVVGEVAKTRLLFEVGRTRVHLDEVEGLGNFLELEVVLLEDEGADAGHAEARSLMEALGVAEEELVDVAYIDLLRRPKDGAAWPPPGLSHSE